MLYDKALDSLCDIMRFYVSPEGKKNNAWRATELTRITNNKDYQDNLSKIVLTTLGTIFKAEPFFWSNNMSRLIAESSKGIEHWKLELPQLPVESGFFYFEDPIELPVSVSDKVHKYIRALSWTVSFRADIEQKTPCVMITFWKVFHDALYARPSMDIGYIWNEGLTVKDMMVDRITNVELAGVPEELKTYEWDVVRLNIFAAAMALISQKLIATTEEKASRNAVRRNAREVNKSTVRVVHLRKYAQNGSFNPEHEPVDWQYQWFVSGHWRSQFYPSIGEHRSIYILPYIKGPEDKPLKPDAERIFAVVR